ncbi:hypothetical protein ASZ90_016723 [hydrocarbon metagenome]|uniref:Uncharacterized protein n=1 Tax=hydrocarbon metagenome TaxID=938273 RepID=A0A0W8EF41_9ZZZZ
MITPTLTITIPFFGYKGDRSDFSDESMPVFSTAVTSWCRAQRMPWEKKHDAPVSGTPGEERASGGIRHHHHHPHPGTLLDHLIPGSSRVCMVS